MMQSATQKRLPLAGEMSLLFTANGLRVVTAQLPHTQAVSVGLYVGVGSRYESEKEAGASHFIEHMLFKGTQRRPTPLDVARSVEGYGGSFNANTGREYTLLWVKAPAPNFIQVLDLLADVLTGSRFAPDDIERERNVILEELTMTLDDPDDYVFVLANKLLWPGHPLGREVMGSEESVRALSRDLLLSFRRRHYRLNNVLFSVAGPLPPGEVLSQIEKVGVTLPDGEKPMFVAAPQLPEQPHLGVRQRPSEQVHFCLTLPGLSRNDPDRFALSILNTILGAGMSSRLFQTLREEAALAYSVESYTESFSDCGLFGVYAGVDAQKVTDAVLLVVQALDHLRQEPVSQAELTYAKANVRGHFLLQLEDSLNVMSLWGEQVLLHDQVLCPEGIIAHIEAVTADDVMAVARRLFDCHRLSLAVLGPVPDGESRFADLLCNVQAKFL